MHAATRSPSSGSAQDAALPTSMVVREDSLTLFGFADDDEQQVFELLQTASGVGPKLAQAMLAVLTPRRLRRAVADDDVTTLTAVPGIGQKGAQRIVLELKDRIGTPPSSRRSAGRPPAPTPGASRCTPRSSASAGRPARPTRRSTPSPPRPRRPTADVGRACSRAALRTLTRP